MLVTMRIFLLAVFFTGLWVSDAVSQGQYVDNLPLMRPQAWDKTKTIPIYSYFDTLYVMTADYYWDDGSCHEKTGYSWHLKFNCPSISQGMEFIMSPQGGLYVYDHIGYNLMFNFSDTTHQERNCPGRPVFDLNDRMHIVVGFSQHDYYYIVSDDTLNSYAIIDTLWNFPNFQRLITNTDHSTVGAVFYDFQNDNIIKYLSAGGYIDFSAPQIFPGEDLENGIYDMMLNGQNELVAVVVHGENSMYVDHYVWTEDFGYSYLSTGFDEALQPIYYEIVFGPDENEIILIGNMLFYLYSNSWFKYSSDGGNTWYRSGFQILSATYGSSPRTYGNTLDFVYSMNMYGDTYYYPIPIDSITDNLTSLNDIELIPEVVNLLRAYPNPFNAKTTIEFSLAGPGDVELTIYDITGAKVETIRRPGLEAGKHTILWDAKDAASGVYFARLEAGGESRSIKMVLLK